MNTTSSKSFRVSWIEFALIIATVGSIVALISNNSIEAKLVKSERLWQEGREQMQPPKMSVGYRGQGVIMLPKNLYPERTK